MAAAMRLFLHLARDLLDSAKLSFVNVATRPDVVDINDVFLLIVPEDDSHVADAEASIACPIARHLDDIWVSVHVHCQTF